MQNKERLLQLLNKQLNLGLSLKGKDSENEDFKKWQRDSEIIIGKIFGEKGRHLDEFSSISYTPSVYYTNQPYSDFEDTFGSGISNACTMLKSMITEFEEFGGLENKKEITLNHINTLENLCQKFFLLARQMRNRHDGRPTLEINDEYDVQDLFHTLLHIYFEDIRPEEWTPSYAGNSSRTDFLLKNEETVIEIKMTRKGLDRKETANQLIIDKERYRNHPNCKYLVCFIYDPEGRIGNPIGFENDLNSNDNGLQTIVIVTPKGH